MRKCLFVALALLLAVAFGPAEAQTPFSQTSPITSPIAYFGTNYEPPCVPSTTTGTITLALGTTCLNPVTAANGGSPDNWQFTLTGNGTLATTGPYKPGQVFVVKVTEGSGTPFTLNAPSGWSVGGLCTGNATPIAYCTGANQFPLSGTANGKNSFACQVIDATPTIWCPSVSAGLSAANSGFTLINHAVAVATSNAVTTGVNTTGADLIVVSMSYWGGGTAPTLIDSVGGNSNIFTQVTGSPFNSGDSTSLLQIWYTRPTHTGSGHTFTCSGTNDFCTIAVEAFSGSVASPLDQINNAGSSSATTQATGSVTPSQANELLITSFTTNDNGTGFSVGSGFTITDAPNSGGSAFSGGMAYLIQGTASAVNPAWSWTGSANVVAAVVTFK